MPKLRIYLMLSVCLMLWSIAPAASAPRAVSISDSQPNVRTPEFMGMAIRDPWYEFNTNPAYPNTANQAFQDTMGATLAQAGVRWVRLEFHIPAGASSEQAAAEIAKNDYFITQVAPRYHFKVLALLGFDLLRGSDAAQLNSGTAVSSHYGGGVNQYMDTWLTRALMIADGYRDQIAAYEILNEENRLPNTGAAITPTIMGRLMTKFYRFCKNIDPIDENHGCTNAQIILGGIHPRGTNDAAKTSDTDYLKQIYTDQSSFGSFYDTHNYYPVDGVAYHPYPEEISLSISNDLVDLGIKRMRDALTEVNDACRRFWITEVGYNVDFDPDGPKNPRPAQTEAGQADFLRDVYTTLPTRALSASKCGANQAEIANVFWFKYEDFPPASIIYDSKGNPISYPQKWGVVRIPITSDSGCEGGCYEVSGKPELYRKSFTVYREMAGYQVWIPVIMR